MNNISIVLDTPEKILFFIDGIIVGLASAAVIIAVLIDFMEFHEKNNIKKRKNSIVETGTMFLFFFLFYYLVRFNVGYISVQISPVFIAINIICMIIVMIGAWVNIAGRFKLGKNWSNQIKIYKDHTFVSSGVYSTVRHPLYASLVWMFLASSVVYMNYLALISVLSIFIPFMYYRAKQEEVMLSAEFKDYRQYQERVGMFFPKIK